MAVDHGFLQRDMSESICVEADRLVSVDRAADYGHPEQDFSRTVGAFNSLTGHKLTVSQGILFMVCVKLSRECNKSKRDNRVDAVGYIKLLDMVTKNEDPRQHPAAANN